MTTSDGELVAVVEHERGRRDAREGHHRAHREVDAAGDDDDGLPDGCEGHGQRRDGQRPEVERAVAGPDELRDDEHPDEQPDERDGPRVTAHGPARAARGDCRSIGLAVGVAAVMPALRSLVPPRRRSARV